MRHAIPAFVLLLALPLGAVAANRVGDADNSGSLNAIDAALVQARVLGVVDEWSISPLALADADGDLDLSDILLVAQAANGQRTLNGPGNWLSFTDPSTLTRTSGDPPFPVFWGVYSLFYGVAENTDGMVGSLSKIPASAETAFNPANPEVSGLACLAQVTPINTTGAQQFVTLRLQMEVLGSAGGAPVASYVRNSTILVEPSVCGNGWVQPGEDCDDGAFNGAQYGCREDCTGACLPSTGFAARFGDSQDQYVSQMAVDDAGNVLLAGSFKGTVDFGDGVRTATSYYESPYLAKFAPNGSLLWSTNFGNGSKGEISSVATDHAGNIIVAGQSYSTLDLGGEIIGSDDHISNFIIKFNPDGATLWHAIYLGAEIADVAVDAAGNVWFTGGLYGDINFGGGLLVSQGYSDILLVKLSPGGAHLSSARFGDFDIQNGNSISVDPAGNAWVAGEFRGTVDFGSGPLVSAGYEDIFLARFDPDGNLLHASRFGDSNSEVATSLATDSTGNAWMTGSFGGTLDFGLGPMTNAGGQDIFLAKFAPGGTALYSTRFGDAYYAVGSAVATDAADRVWLTGNFRNTVDFGGGVLSSAGNDDICLAQFESNGSHLHSARFGGIFSQFGKAVAADDSGNVWVAGEFSSSIDMGTGPLTSAGGRDILLARLSPAGAPLCHECGNGMVEAGEMCDDGAAQGEGQCLNLCTGWQSCGDGVANGSEACDDGNTASCDGCRGDCTRVDALCGDLLSECGEVCDDGDLDSCTPACNAACAGPGIVPVCGNGLAECEETCDSGAMNGARDACDTACSGPCAGHFDWAQRAGGVSGHDYSTQIALDPQGNGIVLGNSSSLTADYGPWNLTGTGDYKMQIAKIAPAGNFLWAKGQGDGYFSGNGSVATDSQGNIYFGGIFFDTTSFGPFSVNAGPYVWGIFGGVPLLGALDSAGNFLWLESQSVGNYDLRIASDSAGNISMAGTHIVDNGSFCMTEGCQTYIELAHRTVQGDYTWRYDIYDQSYATDIGIDSFGRTVVAGCYAGNANLTDLVTWVTYPLVGTGPPGTAMVMQFGPLGDFRWVAQWANYWCPSAIGLDLVGNTYVVGIYYVDTQFGGITLPAVMSGENLFVAKISPQGQFLWAVNAGTTYYGPDITVDAAGNSYVTTALRPNTELGGQPAPDGPVQLKFDPNGNLVWVRSVPVVGYLAVDRPGRSLWTGGWLYDAPLTFGATTLTSAGETDLFISHRNLNGGPDCHECGDGVIAPTEACDDGDLDDCTTACGSDCQGPPPSPVCGNGLPECGETCDDGDLDNCSYACNDACTGPGTAPICGDGQIVCGEACDDGFSTWCGPCNSLCTAPGYGGICGDNWTCPDMETCDDGSVIGEGYCLNDCSRVQTCGDGYNEGTELCDDGNVLDCAGPCSGSCKVALTGCGDGVRCGVEACDDGNSLGCDGCSADCSQEEGLCGDGVVECGEVCDEGADNGSCGHCATSCQGPAHCDQPWLGVGAGGFHTCGLRSDNTLSCWGYNNRGQSLPPGGTFLEVGSGIEYSCGLKTDNTAACWGYPQSYTGIPTVPLLSISVGDSHACGLKADQSAVCWGANFQGKTTAPAGAFLSVSAGYTHSCGIRGDGTVACWGSNSQGQSTPPAGTFMSVSAGNDYTCGIRTDNSLVCWGTSSAWPTPPPAGSFVAVDTGRYHACGIRTDNTVACWGSDSNGRSSPPSGAFLTISLGYDHSCGLRSDNAIVCWGSDQYVQTSVPEGTSLSLAVGSYHLCWIEWDGSVSCGGAYFYGGASPPTGTFLSISSGYYYACGVRTDQSIACWGSNNEGPALPPPGTFNAVSAGTWHACGVRPDGTVSCWGNNYYGQSSPPAGQFAAISAGYNFTCGIRHDRTLACWGSNNKGQSTPPSGSFLAVSAGSESACGIRTDRTVTCWGDNSYAQSSPLPGTFLTVDTGYSNTCAVRTDGTAACWGSNSAGQSTPPGGGFIAIEVGFGSCGLRADNTIACWGQIAR